jgi:toxin ParE1/3/4
MTRIVWSTQAIDDLDAILAYISKDNPTAARRVVARIVERTGRIQQFPESGSFVEEDGLRRYRQVVEGNYRVIYRHNPTSRTAFVITVIHAARLLSSDHFK